MHNLTCPNTRGEGGLCGLAIGQKVGTRVEGCDLGRLRLSLGEVRHASPQPAIDPWIPDNESSRARARRPDGTRLSPHECGPARCHAKDVVLDEVVPCLAVPELGEGCGLENAAW